MLLLPQESPPFGRPVRKWLLLPWGSCIVLHPSGHCCLPGDTCEYLPHNSTGEQAVPVSTWGFFKVGILSSTSMCLSPAPPHPMCLYTLLNALAVDEGSCLQRLVLQEPTTLYAWYPSCRVNWGSRLTPDPTPPCSWVYCWGLVFEGFMSICTFLHTEYGAPEEGELKGRQPLTLKNQLLSKRPEMVKIVPSPFKIFYKLSASRVYMENKRFKSLWNVRVPASNSASLNCVVMSLTRYLLLCAVSHFPLNPSQMIFLIKT